MSKKPPEQDRRTLAYRQAAAERGEFVLSVQVEAFAELMYECEYIEVADKSYWVPTSEIRGVVYAKFPDADFLTSRELGQAIRAAFPNTTRVLRTPAPGEKPVRGFSGIRGPSCVRAK